MNIVIMGAGAIGSLFGGMMEMAQPGAVTLIARQPHVEVIKKNGLQIKGVVGETVLDINAETSANGIAEADVVFITTKAYDSVAAARKIKHLIDNGAYVVVVQNGLGTENQIAKVLGSRRVLRATTCMGAILESPGVVNATGEGITEIGSHYPENSELIKMTVELINDANIKTRGSENIEGVVWTKTIVNCGINPIGAITDMKNGEVYSSAVLRELVIKLVEETVEVVKALGIELTTTDPIRYTLGTAKATANNTNSMLQDIKARKRTEIETITGAVVKMAHKLGLETPTSEAVYALVKAIEAKYLENEDVPDEDITMATDELIKTLSTH
ncbi:2-dehydropantoate 2-reductase [Candidatus Thorarchaeota archaeon]|nr:MAG: 2-dehydropantoate 2-reductase [Candidatus Thorarchaeota archaeon]